jgi:hypothetical protein
MSTVQSAKHLLLQGLDQALREWLLLAGRAINGARRE